MPHAIIRGENGRRHEIDFADTPVRVEIYASEETVEIFIEADSETLPEERRRFALLSVPRHLFSEATAAAARRAANPRAPDQMRFSGWPAASALLSATLTGDAEAALCPFQTGLRN